MCLSLMYCLRLEDAPNLKILRFDDYQLAIPRTAFIPKQADGPESANKLVRYLVSEEGQNRLAPGCSARRHPG